MERRNGGREIEGKEDREKEKEDGREGGRTKGRMEGGKRISSSVANLHPGWAGHGDISLGGDSSLPHSPWAHLVRIELRGEPHSAGGTLQSPWLYWGAEFAIR